MSPINVEIHQSAFWMTNTGIITAPDGSMVLVDPGVFPDELADLARRAGEGRLVGAVATHEDWDHVLWADDFPADLPRLAHSATARVLEAERMDLLRGLSGWEAELDVAWNHDLVGRLQPISGNNAMLGGMRFTFVPTPGHTEGHASIWIEEAGILFAGDMLSDLDIPMLAPMPGVGEAYLCSLQALQPLVDAATMVIPGHGSPCGRNDARRRLGADHAYIAALTAWSLDARRALPGLETLMPGDTRLARTENEDAHRQNGDAMRKRAG